MKRAVVISLVGVLLAASFAAGYLADIGAVRTETQAVTYYTASPSSTSSTSTRPFTPGATTAIDLNASIGLDLVLATNATTLKVGQRLEIGFSLFNLGASANSVSVAQDWPFRGVPVALWWPCYFDTPAYAVLLKGNYTLPELQVAANTTFNFRCEESAIVDHVVFEPNSSLAYLTGSGVGPIPGPYPLSANVTTNDYWDLANQSQLNPPILGMQIPPRPPVPTPFVPGVYTVAVADEWGQAALLHFTVKG